MNLPAPERWKAFLDQIGERHRLLLEEAAVAVREALPACNFNPVPISTAWSAVTHRLKELERRIIDTWHQQVEATFEAEGHGVEVRVAARRRGEDLAFELENQRELGEAQVFAAAARELFAQSLAEHKEHGCASCGAALTVPLAFSAQNLRCGYCGAVSSFEPGTCTRNVVAFGAHALARQAAGEEWLTMRAAERRVREARSPAPLELLKAYERAQIKYWFEYFGAKATLQPELRDVPHEVRCRMEFWYTMTAEHEANWVASGRPREVF